MSNVETKNFNLNGEFYFLIVTAVAGFVQFVFVICTKKRIDCFVHTFTSEQQNKRCNNNNKSYQLFMNATVFTSKHIYLLLHFIFVLQINALS